MIIVFLFVILKNYGYSIVDSVHFGSLGIGLTSLIELWQLFFSLNAYKITDKVINT